MPWRRRRPSRSGARRSRRPRSRIGSPALRAGVAVSITGVDAALEGKWVVSSTRHEFGDGRLPDPLRVQRPAGSLAPRRHRQRHVGVIGRRWPGTGLVVAIVTNNDDPEKLGRVKLKFPWLSDDAESCWAPARRARRRSGQRHGLDPAGRRRGPRRLRARRLLTPLRRRRPVERRRTSRSSGTDLFDAGKVKRRGFVSRLGHKFVFFDGDNKSR